MTFEWIDTGFFYADGGVMFGNIPKRAWQRRLPADHENRCLMVMRTGLIHTDDHRIILIDVGTGTKHLKKLSYYGFFDLIDLKEALLKRNIQPADVTDIILTHLHFDHCGYITEPDSLGKMNLSFPKARHWISQKQWDNYHHPHPLEKDSYFENDLTLLKEEGIYTLTHDVCQLNKDLILYEMDGHTPGQLVPFIQTDEHPIIFAGDVLPLAAQLSPKWISSYDLNPKDSYTNKLKLLTLAKRTHSKILFCHDAKQPLSDIL